MLLDFNTDWLNITTTLNVTKLQHSLVFIKFSSFLLEDTEGAATLGEAQQDEEEGEAAVEEEKKKTTKVGD